jgi:carbamoyltransferase
MHLAASIQKVTEEVVSRLAITAQRELRTEYLCMAGGVALNCVANGRVLREGPFRDIWIQPAAGDAGGAIGAALAGWHLYCDQPRGPREGDRMRGALLGPEFSDFEIRAALDTAGAFYRELDDEAMIEWTAQELARRKVVGWFQGRMEFGPRALGNRSILGDPRDPNIQSVMNLKIKYRESFRPFAPSVLAERVADFFVLDRPSPYMMLVAPVREELRLVPLPGTENLLGIAKLKVPRSTIPAVTHVDYSARIQTVHRDTNARFHQLIRCFERLTGCPLLVNTSFNVRGEPIVCTPADAYRCFMHTEMDALVIQNFVLDKQSQPAYPVDDLWNKEFESD